MLGALASIGIGILSIVKGFEAFGCKTVSFGSNLIACFDHNGGDISGTIAGYGLVLFGGVLVLMGLGYIGARHLPRR